MPAFSANLTDKLPFDSCGSVITSPFFFLNMNIYDHLRSQMNSLSVWFAFQL